jgi:hypothetical protein
MEGKEHGLTKHFSRDSKNVGTSNSDIKRKHMELLVQTHNLRYSVYLFS